METANERVAPRGRTCTVGSATESPCRAAAAVMVDGISPMCAGHYGVVQLRHVEGAVGNALDAAFEACERAASGGPADAEALLREMEGLEREVSARLAEARRVVAAAASRETGAGR
jgi:hypothetical protein